ncbi:MAG: hypothetical protein WDN66_03435 [Candidatus Saccharibacteria bacterium]
MSEWRDTVVVRSSTTEEPNCEGCSYAGDAQGPEGFVNPDCAANVAARNEKGLPAVDCGRILMHYAVDSQHHQVFNGRGITTETIRTLRRVFVEPVGGQHELLRRDYEDRGNIYHRLFIDLETDEQ